MQKRHQPSLLATFAKRLGIGVNRLREANRIADAGARPFQSISIFHGIVCCEAARDVEGYRFLARSAPQLPLSECTMRSTCECRYIKFQDRRAITRRLVEFGSKPVQFAAIERRKRRGRRVKD